MFLTLRGLETNRELDKKQIEQTGGQLKAFGYNILANEYTAFLYLRYAVKGIDHG